MLAPMASVTFEQKQPFSNRNSHGSIRLIVYIRRATFRQRTELDSYSTRSGTRSVAYRHLRRYLFSAFFLIYANHERLHQIRIIGESKPRIQRWMQILSYYNYHLSYRRGRKYANSNFLSRLPLPPAVEGISGSSALTDPDDLGVYVIRACDYVAPPCPIQGVGLGGLALSSYPAPFTGIDDFVS